MGDGQSLEQREAGALKAAYRLAGGRGNTRVVIADVGLEISEGPDEAKELLRPAVLRGWLKWCPSQGFEFTIAGIDAAR